MDPGHADRLLAVWGDELLIQLPQVEGDLVRREIQKHWMRYVQEMLLTPGKTTGFRAFMPISREKVVQTYNCDRNPDSSALLYAFLDFKKRLDFFLHCLPIVDAVQRGRGSAEPLTNRYLRSTVAMSSFSSFLEKSPSLCT